MAVMAMSRTGQVVCHRSGASWAVEVRLDENDGTRGRAHAVFLNRTFLTEAAARVAGEHAVREWEVGRTGPRELMLQELAAAYRKLRETYRPMQPPSVPATQAAWESAFDAWEGLGWITPTDAVRYRGHVSWVFSPESAGIRRHRLPPSADSDPTH